MWRVAKRAGGTGRRRAPTPLDWGFGPAEGQPEPHAEASPVAGDPQSTSAGSGLGSRRALVLLVIASAAALFAGGRAWHTHRVLSEVERDVTSVYRLEMEALRQGDLEVLEELQAPTARGEALLALQGGGPRPLPAIALEKGGEGRVIGVEPVGVDASVAGDGAGDANGDPNRNRRRDRDEDGTRDVDVVDLVIAHRAIADGSFEERRRYERQTDGEWRHALPPPPARSELTAVDGLTWIQATATAEDMEVVRPALELADAALGRVCTGEHGCPDVRGLRFSGNRPGRLADISSRDGAQIALPSPSMTFRPVDDAGRRRYAREIASLVLLSAAGQDVVHDRAYEDFLNIGQGRAPVLRRALWDVFAAEFELADMEALPPGADGAWQEEVDSIWSLWWSEYELPDAPPRDDAALASAARRFVEEITQVHGAEVLPLMRAISRAHTPEEWLRESLAPEVAEAVVMDWPQPPPAFPAARPLLMACQWEERPTWLMPPGGSPIDVSPLCGENESATRAAWSPDGRRFAVACNPIGSGWMTSRIEIFEAPAPGGAWPPAPAASLDAIEAAVLDLEWAADGHLFWRSFDRFGRHGAAWAEPEDGESMTAIGSSESDSSDVFPTESLWSVYGRRLIQVEGGGDRRTIRLFAVDGREGPAPIWSLEGRGRAAKWDGRSERFAVLSGLQENAGEGGGEGVGVGVGEGEGVGVGVTVSVHDVETGHELARRSIGASDTHAIRFPAGQVPDWTSARLVGLDDASGYVALLVNARREEAGDDLRDPPDSSSIVIWRWDEPTASPIVHDYTKHIMGAAWIDADHPDAPNDGTGGATLSLVLMESVPPSLDNGDRGAIRYRPPRRSYETLRVSGERRFLERPIDEIDPSGRWRIRSRSGRLELRRVEDGALAWWFNAPSCSRFRWGGP